ncbi:hypothetical protein FOZ63_001460, partial [Perkinsus olseni]
NNYPSSSITTVEPVMLTTETTAAMKTEEECQAAFTWCRDFADVSGQCRTKVCIDHKLIENMTLAAFVLAGLALILDIIDMVIFVATPDSVILKSFINLSSSCIKWVAFGVVLGSGADQFMSDVWHRLCSRVHDLSIHKEEVRRVSMELRDKIIIQNNKLDERRDHMGRTNSRQEGHDKNRSSDRRILPVLLDTLQSLGKAFILHPYNVHHALIHYSTIIVPQQQQQQQVHHIKQHHVYAQP